MWMTIVALFLFVALVVWAVTGGADFGGGAWDLFARGPRADQQRRAIEAAIGPIWEANHVWLIVVIVLLFVAFPAAFYAIMTVLHIPLLFMLLGMVLRGASFVFRSYGPDTAVAWRGWSRVFAVASTLTPVMLGISLGTVISGNIVLDPETLYPQTDFISEWTQPFPLLMGLFVAVLFAYLAAVYLAADVDDGELREDFRRRALVSGVVMGVVAAVTLIAARSGAPVLFEGLVQRPWTLAFHGATGLAAVLTFYALWQRRFQLARLAAIAHVGLMISGWALAQAPMIIPTQLTFEMAAAPVSVLRPLSLALIIGLVFLVPAFAYLYIVFKRPLPSTGE